MGFGSKPGKYHPAYDCLLEQDILFRVDPHCLPADNPAQAETSSGSGANANFRCRYDKSGGTAAERETDEGYHAQFEVTNASNDGPKLTLCSLEFLALPKKLCKQSKNRSLRHASEFKTPLMLSTPTPGSKTRQLPSGWNNLFPKLERFNKSASLTHVQEIPDLTTPT